jgi:ABC-2 type transport system permease protein
MLNDALASEAYKLRRNLTTLFWGFAFVPLGLLLFDLALDIYLRLHVRLGDSLDLRQEIIRALGLGGSSAIQIFFAAGAAAIFAGEYRWETWRLQTTRNTRLNLLAAKFLIYAAGCAASLAALAAIAVLNALFGAFLNGASLVLPQAGFVGGALVVFAASWAELLVLGAFVALVAIASRAMIAALMAGIFFSFAQSVAMVVLHPWEAPLKDFALLPSLCAYLLRAWASGQEVAPGVYADPAKVIPAALILVAWIGVLTGAAAAVFHKQDLPRE